jgi:tetratricopeptide (TPR) repeat protein
MKSRFVGAVVLAIVATAATAAAETPKEKQARAVKLYEDGLAKFNAAAYAEAVALWQESYDLSRAPLLLFNLGQAYRLSGDCTKALSFYDRYIGAAPDAPNKSVVDQAVVMCSDPGTGTEKGTGTAAATGTAAGTGTASATESATPSPSTVHAEPFDGAQGKRSQSADTSAETTAVTDTSTDTETERRDDPSRGGGKRKVGLAVGIVGVAAAGTGVWFALRARDAAGEVADHTGVWDDEAEALERRGKRDDKLAVSLLVGGGVAIAAGTVLYVLGRRERSSGFAATVLPEGGAAITFGGGF